MLQRGHDIHKAALGLAGRDVLKALHVLRIAFFQHDVFGVCVTKQRDGINGRVLKVAERDDIPERLGGVIDAIGARERPASARGSAGSYRQTGY